MFGSQFAWSDPIIHSTVSIVHSGYIKETVLFNFNIGQKMMFCFFNIFNGIQTYLAI